jgi:hypothetical protein
MTERVIISIWWTLVMGFIALGGIGAVFAGYWGISELLTQRWQNGIAAVLLAAALGAVTWLACRCRTDLIYG